MNKIKFTSGTITFSAQFEDLKVYDLVLFDEKGEKVYMSHIFDAEACALLNKHKTIKLLESAIKN